jgi:general secretion pathway protein D
LRAVGIFRPKLVIALSTTLCLGACAQSGSAPTTQSSRFGQFMQGVDVTAREPQTIGAAGTVQPPGTGSTGPKMQAMFWDGDGGNRQALAEAEVQRPIQQVNLNFEGAQAGQANAVTLNFENADIKTVAHAVLGEVLGVNYTIDPRVTGSISLSSRRPVQRGHVMVLLESALRAQGAVIIEQGGIYNIIPAKDATGAGQTNIGFEAGTPGYGISVLPLENISAESLVKILDGFGAHPGSVRIDSGRNLLIVQGTSAERQTLIDTALAFDVDWMRHQSVGMFPLQNAMPEVVIKELGKMVDPAVVRLQPVGQMNAIMAVSKNAKTIREVSTWVSRLDRLDGNSENIHVYQLKNGDARKVASVLKSAFLGQSSSQGSLNEKDEVAPGGGTVTGASAAHAPITSAASPKLASAADPKGLTDADRLGQEDLGIGEGTGNESKSKIRIVADTVNNSVVVYANAQDYRPVERAIMVLDRPELQVAIEATVAEVTLNNSLNYGVQAFLQKGSFSFSNFATSLPLTMTPGLNLLQGAVSNPQIVINALQTVTEVRVLSSPSLVVVDNQPAVLQVGDSVPVTTTSATSVVTAGAPIVNQVSYVDTGVILRVIPRVHSNATVTLDVEQVVSQVAAGSSAASLTPTISQRKVKSTVSVPNGQTVVLAGLMSEQRIDGGSGLPGIAGIPVIGALMGTMTPSLQRTEIIVFIRPQIIRNSADAQRVAEQLRGRMTGFNQ